MGLDTIYEEGQTPLDEDEKVGLRNKTISTHKELDELEQLNVEKGFEWSLRRKFPKEIILSEKYVNDLHRRMFGNVWRWAGKFRKTDKNIGIDKNSIAISLRILLDDCKFWIENNAFKEDETAIRFKHRLVSIHCFPNGNGRHSRLMADIIVKQIFQREPFSWGGNKLSEKGEDQKKYLFSLREADKGEYKLLIEFARS